MGADVSANAGRPPITIKPVEKLEGIEYAVPVASAQVKSCVLLAGLYARGETAVMENVATRDHTERMLRGFGIDVRSGETGASKFVSVSPNSALFAGGITIPGDISAAAFSMVAAACFPDSQVTLIGLGLNPTRSSILDLLIQCGAEIDLTDQSTSAGEPLATVTVRGMRSVDGDPSPISGVRTAEMIDELPIIAILGTQLENGLTVRDAKELRFKETDRIAAVVENLRRMDANVEEFEDGFLVRRSELKGAEIEPFGDHRIAMAFAVAGLLAVGETTIKDNECVDISFPGFFETLESVVKR